MQAEEAITAKLLATPAVTAVFGSTPIRLYPIQIPQGATYPALAYQRIAARRVRNLTTGRSTLARVWLQLTIQAKTYTAASNAARVLRSALEGWRETLGDGTRINGVLWLDGESNERNVDSLLFDWFSEIAVWINE